jgi:hypothetical protein
MTEESSTISVCTSLICVASQILYRRCAREVQQSAIESP